ncbi:Rv3654c family TadE-like protein [Streptomyces sp. NPDC017520]|uniref:Rv3654c family TadE-like protein n=1 Tax=Streptomyces sp. NPDC017520 TaxID=3364998 RepID=UPI00378EF808
MKRGADRGAGRRRDRIAAWLAARLAARRGGQRGGRIERRIANPRAGLGADRGVATVWVAVTAASLCTVFAVVLALGQAVAARHRAGGAADLAALAAADRALEGTVAACGTARRVAQAQGAVLIRCVVHGEIADVTARSGFGPYLPAVRARAGPPVGPGASSPVGPGAGRSVGPGASSPVGPGAGRSVGPGAGPPTGPEAGRSVRPGAGPPADGRAIPVRQVPGVQP